MGCKLKTYITNVVIPNAFYEVISKTSN